MTSSELPSPTQDIRNFDQLLMPYMLADLRKDEPMSPAGRHILSRRIATEGAPFAHFQRDMNLLLNPQGEFADTLAQGRYPRIAKLAGKTALQAMSALGELRGHNNMSLADTFGLHALLSAVASINRPNRSRVPHTVDRTAYFLAHLSTQLAMAAPTRMLHEENYFDFAEKFHPSLPSVSTGTFEDVEWFERKLFMLADRLTLRQHLTRIIESEPTIEGDDLLHARKNNNNLFKELRRLRCYSIKSAIHVSGDSEWSIHDGITFETSRLAVAAEEIAMHQWPPNIVMAAIERPGNSHRIIIPEFSANDERPEYTDLGRIVFMDDSGDLYADILGAIPYASLYEQAGKPQNYEALRQYLLQKMFDLTVPITIVQEVNADTATMLRSKVRNEMPTHLLSDLLLPRIRRLKQYKTLGEFERSVAALEAQEAAALKTPTTRREHPVVAHRRTLPEGYKPSREALALAKELGIELEPNQTIVKDHNRGDKAKGTITHKAKGRKKQ